MTLHIYWWTWVILFLANGFFWSAYFFSRPRSDLDLVTPVIGAAIIGASGLAAVGVVLGHYS